MHSDRKNIENILLCGKMADVFTEESTVLDKSERDFPVKNYEFEAYSLSEVAVMAKTDEAAMEEYLDRVHPVLARYGKYICDLKQYVDYSEILAVLEKAAVKVVTLYDPKYGYPIDNLLRKNLKVHYRWHLKNEAVQYYRKLTALGKRICVDDVTFYDSVFSVASPEREIVERIDFDAFQGTLSPTDRQMLLLYLSGYSFRDIAEVMMVSPSTVSYRIYHSLERFQNRTKKGH